MKRMSGPETAIFTVTFCTYLHSCTSTKLQYGVCLHRIHRKHAVTHCTDHQNELQGAYNLIFIIYLLTELMRKRLPEKKKKNRKDIG